MTTKTITKIIKNEAGEDVEVTEEVEVVDEKSTEAPEAGTEEKDKNPLEKIKQALDGDKKDKQGEEVKKEETSNAELNALVETLKQEKANLLKEVMAKKAKLQEYEGINAEEAKKLLEEKKKAEEAQKKAEMEQAEKENNWEAVKKQMNEQHEAQKNELQKQIDSLREQIAQNQKEKETLLINNKFEESRFIRENLVLSPNKTRALYGSYFDVEGSELVAYNAPKGSANRARLVDVNGNNLTFDKAIEKIVNLDPDKNTLLKSKVHVGSGSKPVITGEEFEYSVPKMTALEKIQQGLSKNEK